MMKSKAELHQEQTNDISESPTRNEGSSNSIIKGQKNLKQEQKLIKMPIENNVIELVQKFDFPLCMNCPKRKADRVCINKECGLAKYMQIICGKCHADLHAKALNKSELDIEEYFIKLTLFINEQKQLNHQIKSSYINFDQLNFVLNDINKIREQFTLIKSQIKNDKEGYQSPQLVYSNLQSNITQALSNFQYQNKQEQLQSIKKSVLFDKNQFIWNDQIQKYRLYTNSMKEIEDSSDEVMKRISKSFIWGDIISFNNLKMVSCSNKTLFCLNRFGTNPDILPTDGVFKITVSKANEAQYYLDYKLDWEKKYKLRIKFTQNPKAYVMVGIMPLSLVNTKYVFNVTNEYFCKRFFSSQPNKECGRIIKGVDLGNFPKEGTQIEMRIDLENNYMDFADYPDYNNINANHTHFKLQSKEPYVIAFGIYQDQTLIVESLETISQLNLNYNTYDEPKSCVNQDMLKN